MRLNGFILGLFLLAFVGCSSPTETSNETAGSSSKASAVRDVSPKEASEGIKGDVQFIDVRSESEFEAYRVEGSKNIPIDRFDDAIPLLDKAKPIYLVCEVGIRSTDAAERLAAAGFTDVRHIEGGIRAWEKAGLPVREKE